MKLKKVLSLALTVIMTMLLVMTVSASGDLKVIVDGTEMKFDVSPTIIEGRTLVPIRAVAEALGGDVQWDAGTKTVSITTADTDISLVIDSKTPTVNGEEKTIDVPAMIMDGRTLVPLRFVGEALNASVNYDGSSKTITINYFTNLKGTLKMGGSTTVQPVFQDVADKLIKKNQGLSITVAGGGSGAGIKGAMDGTFNIGGASRELSDSELKSNPDIYNIKIGSDGIAVIASKENSITNLTKKQVFDIFTGKTTNWKDVGGVDAPILVQTRETGSGTLGAFEELALMPIDKKAKVATTATPHTSNGLIKDAVAKNKNSIGFLSLGFVDGSVNAVKVDGVSATKVNALTKKWPYVRPLNIVTKGKPTGLTAQFINYLTSPDGQAVVVKENYLPLKVED